MPHHEIYLLFLAFFSELIGTATGIGSSSLFVPFGVYLENIQLTLALTAVLHVIGNLSRTFLYWRNINWNLTLKFGLPAVIMTGAGARYSDALPKEWFSVLLGIFLILFSAMQFFFNFLSNRISERPWLSYIAGGVSGLLTGLLGSGGAVRSLALTGFGLNPMSFTATSTLIDFGGDIFRLGIYLKKGYLDSGHYFYLPLIMIVAFFANRLAKKWLVNIGQERFRKIVLILVFLTGVFSFMTGLFSQLK